MEIRRSKNSFTGITHNLSRHSNESCLGNTLRILGMPANYQLWWWSLASSAGHRSWHHHQLDAMPSDKDLRILRIRYNEGNIKLYKV